MQSGTKSVSEQVSVTHTASPAPIVRALAAMQRVQHENELDWFFCEGESLFEASTFGAVLERQALFGQILDTCDKCEGSGFNKDDGTCASCKGSGGKPRRLKNPQHPNPMRLGSRVCEQCKGGGLRRVSRRKNSLVRFVCTACDRRGFVLLDPVGQLSAGHGEEASYTPDDGALMRFARVSRWIMRVRPGSARILEAFHGHVGCNWGATKWGRLFAVVPFTASGHTMLSRVANPLALSDSKLLRNLCEQLSSNPGLAKQTNLAERLREATVEANSTYTAAVNDWNAAVARGRA